MEKGLVTLGTHFLPTQLIFGRNLLHIFFSFIATNYFFIRIMFGFHMYEGTYFITTKFKSSTNTIKFSILFLGTNHFLAVFRIRTNQQTWKLGGGFFLIIFL